MAARNHAHGGSLHDLTLQVKSLALMRKDVHIMNSVKNSKGGWEVAGSRACSGSLHALTQTGADKQALRKMSQRICKPDICKVRGSRI